MFLGLPYIKAELAFDKSNAGNNLALPWGNNDKASVSMSASSVHLQSGSAAVPASGFADMQKPGAEFTGFFAR